MHVALEDGSEREVYQDANDSAAVTVDDTLWGEATFHIPGDLPLGFHQLVLRSDGFEREYTCPLIITPQRLSTADKFVDSPVSGVMAQLYSVRSQKSWGMGDFGDLGELAEVAAREAGADFLLINPLHAAEPEPPVEDSPYLPTTRRFINPIYLRIEDIPELELLDADLRADVEEIAAEFRGRNRSAEPIERNPIFEAKLAVLRELFALQHTEARQKKFKDFTRREGEGLARFAQWCARKEALSGHHAADDEEEQANSVAFYSWLQFLCDEQLGAAHQRALDAGMKIGIITDLAVGVHPGGADAEILSEYLTPQASVARHQMITTSKAKTGPNRHGTQCTWRRLATNHGGTCWLRYCAIPAVSASITFWDYSACSGFRACLRQPPVLMWPMTLRPCWASWRSKPNAPAPW